MKRIVFTIGHSTRTLAEFVALLRQVDVTMLVDVRAYPRSRTTPQFNGDTLPDALAADAIGYRHLRTLGGRRHHRKGAPPSVNMYWRVEHIMGRGQVVPATLTPGTRLMVDGSLHYPPPEDAEAPASGD